MKLPQLRNSRWAVGGERHPPASPTGGRNQEELDQWLCPFASSPVSDRVPEDPSSRCPGGFLTPAFPTFLCFHCYCSHDGCCLSVTTKGHRESCPGCLSQTRSRHRCWHLVTMCPNLISLVFTCGCPKEYQKINMAGGRSFGFLSILRDRERVTDKQERTQGTAWSMSRALKTQSSHTLMAIYVGENIIEQDISGTQNSLHPPYGNPLWIYI